MLLLHLIFISFFNLKNKPTNIFLSYYNYSKVKLLKNTLNKLMINYFKDMIFILHLIQMK